MASLFFTDPVEEESAEVETNDVSSYNFDPEGFEGYFHAAIEDGAGVLIDGEQRNREKLIESVESVLAQLSTNPNGHVKAARGQFLTDVCRIFRLPTTIGNGDALDQASVIDDLKQIPEDIVGKSEEVISRSTKPFEPMEGDHPYPNSTVENLSSDDDDDDENEMEEEG